MLWFCELVEMEPEAMPGVDSPGYPANRMPFVKPIPRRRAPALALLLALAATPVPAAGPDPVASFDQLRQLAGHWSGRREDPLNGPPVTVRYAVVANGRAVTELQNSGEPWAALTVYALASGKLEATHFSPAGNQPRWALSRKSTPTLLVFELDGSRGMDADDDGYVWGGEIRLVAPDRIEQVWHHHVGPKRLGTTHWFLQRVPDVATEAPP